jgi:uncharacterized membrane protein YdbT with pleckstrin-like domain
MIEIDKSEQILKIVRKHWFILLGDLVVLIVSLLIPGVVLILSSILPVEDIFSFTGSPLAVGGMFIFAWLTLVWMAGWHMWTDYYLDVLIVTDKRIFDIDQKGLFSRLSSSFRLDRIQNVTVDQNGIIQTLLDFGTLRLETAGEREDFIARYISHPHDIKKFINELQDKALDRSQLVHLDAATIKKLAEDTNENDPEKSGQQ